MAEYLSGEDPEIVAANKRYQDAVARLSNSLTNRKMLFDPTLLAMAEGFLGPTQTGSFGEALGRVAGKVGAAQEAEQKRQLAFDEREVAVAGQGIELQRMKARDAELLKYLDDSQPPSGPLAGPQAGAIAGPRALTLPKIGDKYPHTYIDPIDRKYGTTETRTVTQDDLDQAKNYKGTTVQLPLNLTAPRGVVAPAGALAQAATQPAGPKVVGSPQGALESIKTNKPSGFEGVDGVQVMPANPDFMTARQYIRLNRMDKSKSAGDLIKEAQEINQKRYRDRDIGVVDLASGKLYEFPTGKQETVSITGYPGTHTIDARAAARLSFLAMNNDPAYHDLAKQIMEGPRKRVDASAVEGRPADAGGKPSEAGGTPNVLSGTPNVLSGTPNVLSGTPRASSGTPRASSGVRKSVEELALDQQIAKNAIELDLDKQKKMQGAEVDSEIEARKDFSQRRRDADETITTANVFRRFAADPKAKEMFGILSNDKVFSGIATLIQGGIGTSNFRIGVPEIENVMRNADLKPAEQAKYRTFLMYVAQMQLQQAKYMKGSVSNYEQQLMGSAGINGQDTPESIRIKADLLTRRAQFDRRAVKAFRESKMTNSEFIESDKYNEMRDAYNTDLAELASGSKILVMPSAPAANPSAGGAKPSVGFIADPVTGIIRKKKAGE